MFLSLLITFLQRMKDDFIGVLLVAALSHKTTIEHEFMSVVLSLDGLQHPLFHGAPFDPTPGTRKFEVSEDDYEASRTRLIESKLAMIAHDRDYDDCSSRVCEHCWVSSYQGGRGEPDVCRDGGGDVIDDARHLPGRC